MVPRPGAVTNDLASPTRYSLDAESPVNEWCQQAQTGNEGQQKTHLQPGRYVECRVSAVVNSKANPKHQTLNGKPCLCAEDQA